MSHLSQGVGVFLLCFTEYDFHQVKFRIRWQELLEGLAGGVVDVHGVCSHENQDDGDTLRLGLGFLGGGAKSAQSLILQVCSGQIDSTQFQFGGDWKES